MTAEREKNQRPRVPSVHEATGEFSVDELSSQTAELPPPAADRPADPTHTTGGRERPAAPFDATGEFTLPTAEPPREEKASPPARDGDPATLDIPGAFGPQDVAATCDGHTHQGKAGHATGQIAGRMTGAAAPGRDQPTAPQTRTGRYAMKRFHARGGMGEVWLAEDSVLGRPVALKKIRGGAEGMKERFLLEAQITGQLEHPGVIPVHELGADDAGQPYYAMRFIHGRTLQDAIESYHAEAHAKGPDEVAHLRLMQVFLNLCQTVAYAHSRGVLHRDLKPDNVMVGEYGETLLLDWGLAKVIGEPEAEDAADAARTVRLTHVSEVTRTLAGAIKGTPGYMSPEAAEGANESVDKVSDVYLLGATLYHILTGQAPRKGKTLFAIITEARKTPPPAPRTVVPTVPRPLDAICRKAMAFAKADRYQSAQALAEDLQRYLAGEPVSAYRETAAERAWRWMKRHRQMLTWSAAGVAVLLATLLGFAKYRQVEAERAQERAEAADRLREEEETRVAAQAKADLLQKQDEARERVRKFRRLADETRFYASTPDPAGEQAPAFHDMENADARGNQALALVADWGRTLNGLPLDAERPAVRRDVADLLLLLAQTRVRRADDAPAAREVLSLLDRAAALRPPSASYHRLRAQANRLLGDEEQAEADQRRADDPMAPSTALDHYLRGLAYQAEAARSAGSEAEGEVGRGAREKRMKQAIEQYRAALLLDPSHYWANLQLGSSYLALGSPVEAAESVSACVALQPAAPWGYAVRGLALVAQKRFGEATADLDRAIALSPDFRLPRLNRGVAYWLQQKYDEALADFVAVLQPPDGQRLIEGAYYRGQVQLERGQFKEALASFDEVVAARRAFRSLHLFRARCFLSLGDRPAALAALNDFLNPGRGFDPDSPEAHGRRGRLLRAVLIPKLPPPARRLALVLAHDQLEAARKGTRSATVFGDLGAIQEQLGQTAEAVASYTEALKLAPKDVKLRVKRGWAQADLTPPEYDKARDDFEQAVRQEPANAEANAGLGYIHACRKAPAEARRAANLALLHGAGDYLVLHNVACVYAKLAQANPVQSAEYEELAIDYLQRAIELWRRGGTGPSEVRMIQGESSFHPALRARPEFKKLLQPQAF